VITGHRYGSMTGSISYTEKEFDYAASKGIPVYGFIVDEAVQPLAKHVDSEAKKKTGLAKFRQKVKQRPVSFWKSAEDLHGRVSIALMKAFNTNPQIGWTRGVSAAGPEVSQELSRLSKENSELRQQIQAFANEKASDQLAETELILETLESNKLSLNIRERGKQAWDHKRPTDLLEIFRYVAPELVVERSVEDISVFLAVMYKGAKLQQVSVSFPIASNHVKSLMVDMQALGVVEPSKRKHAVADKSEYWCLTDLGAELLKLERRKRLQVAANREETKP
jgi:hypothetical protein